MSGSLSSSEPILPDLNTCPAARVLLWVGFAALLVRLLYFTEHATSPFFQIAILDEKFYEALGRTLAEGRDPSRLNPGFRPWLYPFFLAGWFRLSSEWGYVLALAAQHLLGALTAVLVADLAMRLFRRPRAGALAGALYVLAGPPLFFEGELLITGVFTFLATAQLWILSRADLADRRSSASAAAAWWLVAGLWTVLAAQARPNMLLFLAAYPAAALLIRGARPARRRLLAAVALAGSLAALVCFAFLGRGLTGRFQLVAGSGGVNFYLGNKIGADGMIPRQDRRVTYGDEYRDSVQVFAEQLYLEQNSRPRAGAASADALMAASPVEVSRFWLGRAVEDIAADPARWLALMARKTLFLTWSYEIPNNKSYDFISGGESRLLSWLPVRWWLLLSFGLLGLIHAARQRSGDRLLLFWISAFLCLHGLGVVLFFVNSRYRIPMWPAMAILAAGGLLSLIEKLKRRALADTAVAVLIATGLAAVSLVNWLRVEPPSFARDYFFRSLANMEKGRLEEALADARTSVGIDSVAAAARFHLGNVELAMGENELAYRHYRIASYLSPPEPRILNNLGIVIERRNRPGLAYRYYQSALDLADDYAPALVNAALLELRAGLRKRAAEKVARAEELEFDSVLLLCARAFLEREGGNLAAAEDLLEHARIEDPDTVERLVEENRRRLVPTRLQRPER